MDSTKAIIHADSVLQKARSLVIQLQQNCDSGGEPSKTEKKEILGAVTDIRTALLEIETILLPHEQEN
jgi:hypothetical protein